MAKIGVQGMMLKDDFALSGPFETMRSISEIGYHAIEVSQIPMTRENVLELNRSRSELGIDVAALSAGWKAAAGSGADSLESDLDKIVADCHTLGATMVRIPMLPFDAMVTRETVLDFCDAFNETARRLANAEIRLCYHHHHFEFARYGGEYLLDIIADRAPLVEFEIDVHWVQRGGLDPVTVLRKYRGRVAMVHLKDYRIEPLSEAVIASLNAGASGGTIMSDVIHYAEVGEGSLDFSSIIDASIEIGAEYLLVEQDDCYQHSALECLRTSHDNLVELGYADLF